MGERHLAPLRLPAASQKQRDLRRCEQWRHRPTLNGVCSRWRDSSTDGLVPRNLRRRL